MLELVPKSQKGVTDLVLRLVCPQNRLSWQVGPKISSLATAEMFTKHD